MEIPVLAPLRDLLRARAGDVTERAATATAMILFGVVAVSLMVASGIVALAALVGFPLAALVFALVFALLSLAIHLRRRVLSARRREQARAARKRAATDLALAAELACSVRPFLPLAAFVVAFILARRS